MNVPLAELTNGSESTTRSALQPDGDIALALVADPASSLLTVRSGRIGFFAHEPQSGPEPPPVVRKWLDHEQTILAALQASGQASATTEWSPGDPWVVWRLLSGNNREIGRGVGVYRSLDSARAAAERVMSGADRFEATYVFDRHVSHGWCLRLDSTPVVVSPLWHRSRRVNRLNLETVRLTLGRAEVNDVATQLGLIRNRTVTLP